MRITLPDFRKVDVRFVLPAQILLQRLAKPSASDKSRLRQCMLPAGTVPPKVWPESESSSLDAARFSDRLEHRQCRRVDVWQNPVGVFPRARNDPIARVNSRKLSSENEASERGRYDVATGRTPVSVQIHFRSLTPDENSIVRARVHRQISSRLRREPSRSQPRPVYDCEGNNRESQPRVRDRRS
jgi:hypothetical protein